MQHGKKQRPPAPETVVITGMGIVTPVGASLWSTMLALRARRSCYRAHEIVLVADDPTGLTLRGATVSRMDQKNFPRECSGSDRLAALLNPAVTECITIAAWPGNLQLGWESDLSPEMLDPSLSRNFLKKDSSPDAPLTTRPGRCSLFARVARATEELLAGHIDGVIVACADSLCDTPRLTELLYQGRLKDAANPYGLMAGEAGGAFLLERETSARRRGAVIWGRLTGWGAASDSEAVAALPSTARGLTEAFLQAFSFLKDSGASVGMVITDENGDRQRALDWAFTAGRIFPNPERERTVRHPAVFTGDSGNSLGAIILADVLAHFCWHPASQNPIAVAVSDDDGERRVLCIEPGERRGRREVVAGIRKHLGNTKNDMLTER